MRVVKGRTDDKVLRVLELGPEVASFADPCRHISLRNEK